MLYKKQFDILDKIIIEMKELLEWEKEQNEACTLKPNIGT